MDCARESVKTSSNAEDSSRSDEFKKGSFAFDIFETNANFDFP